MKRLRAIGLACLAALPCAAQLQQEVGLVGHVPATLNGGMPEPGFQDGISFYATVFTLTAEPIYQVSLGSGSWLVPDNRSFNEPLCPVGTVARDHWPERGPSYRDVYQTLEGGLGSWAWTRFPTSGPKFRINAIPDCYSHKLGTPGFDFDGEPLPSGMPGFAQLSNRLVLSPDGTTFAGTDVARLFGYGWFALPLIPPYTSPAGVPTGDRSWTLFFHATNFRGPVGFFPPETWSAVNATDTTGVGRGHDARPGFANGVALEIGTAPMFTATASDGLRYRRIAPISFPVDISGRSILVQDYRWYGKAALWDGIAAWMDGGPTVQHFAGTGTFEPQVQNGAIGLHFESSYVAFDTSLFTGGAVALDGGRTALGITWGSGLEPGIFPEYYRESGGVWSMIPASQVPADTQLAEQHFTPKPIGNPTALNISAGSPWSASHWAAGPFSVRLNDGSTVDYVWYRFRDQPALRGLGLAPATLDRLQAFAEALHHEAGVAGVSFAPPTSGTLAQLDSAQIVTPPPGLEAGFVPIAIRQYATESALVTHYYRSILNREPDPGGKEFWEGESARLQALGANINEIWFVMAGNFFTCPEYVAANRNDTEFITDLYEAFYKRAPDSGGLAHWAGQIAAGMPREVVLYSFMFSPEFVAFTKAFFGDTTARPEVDMVMDFFRGVLNRLPDNQGFHFWLDQLRTAQCAGAGEVYAKVNAISTAFIHSAEYAYRARTNPQFVGDMYYSFLRRGGDLEGVKFWIDQLDNRGKDRNNLRAQFVASPEFGARVNAVIAAGCLQ